MFCTNCGAKNSEDARFCANCGDELKKIETPNAAPAPPPRQVSNPVMTGANMGFGACIVMPVMVVLAVVLFVLILYLLGLG